MTSKRPTHYHPDRAEMLKAARTGKVPFRTHLDTCEACNIEYEVLKLSISPRPSSGIEPSSGLLTRHASVPFLVGNWVPANLTVGRTVDDSWSGLPALAVRDAAMGMERHLRFSSGPVTLVLNASRTPDGWRFVARVYRKNKTTQEFVLKLGREKLQPGFRDCYYWTANQPPRRLQLLSPSLGIDVEDIKW